MFDGLLPLLDLKYRSGDLAVEIKGVIISLRILKATHPTSTVIFTFHGAIDRTKRTVPVFIGPYAKLKTHCHQIAIADPALEKDFPEQLGMTWYAGFEGFDAQVILQKLCAEIAAVLGCSRLVFFGGSGGGFAALRLSHAFPRSVALVTNPQTSLGRYYKNHLNRYQKICWPKLSSSEKLTTVITDNLCQLYGNGYENTVIYIQAAADFFHIFNHMIPFLTACQHSGVQRLLVFCDFWGKMGHSGSVGSSEFMPWLQTLILSPSLEISDLFRTFAQLKSVIPAVQEVKKLTDEKENNLAPDKVVISELLRDYHLGQPLNR